MFSYRYVLFFFVQVYSNWWSSALIWATRRRRANTHLSWSASRSRIFWKSKRFAQDCFLTFHLYFRELFCTCIIITITWKRTKFILQRTSSGTRRVGSATGGGGVGVIQWYSLSAIRIEALISHGPCGLSHAESGTVRGGAMAAAGGLSPNTSATTGSDRKKLVMDESDPYKQQGATLRVNQSGEYCGISSSSTNIFL